MSDNDMEFVKWQSIEKFASIHKYANKFKPSTASTFRSKIKLHGTNASIHFGEDGEVRGGKRSSFVTVLKDNAGFARWVLNNFQGKVIDPKLFGCVFHGEWAGKGIQKTDAVSEVEPKTFFVFTVRTAENEKIYEPDEIQKYVEAAGLAENDDVKVIPWYDEEVSLNLHDRESSQSYFESLISEVDKIGDEDPYIKSEFGVSGPGEGLVVYCTSDKDSQLMFKVKTEKHSVNKVKDRKSIKIEFSENAKAFVEQFFTETRFEQIKSETIEGDIQMPQLGQFIRDVLSDVAKESKDELAASPNVEWKEIASMGVRKVKSWFITQIQKI